jgi:cell wall-associated NlpC family hydrolase
VSLSPVIAAQGPTDPASASFAPPPVDGRTFAALLQSAAATDAALMSMTSTTSQTTVQTPLNQQLDGVTTLGEMVGGTGGPPGGFGDFGLLSATHPGLRAAGLGSGSDVGGRTGTMLDAALSQVGTPYVFGAEAATSDPDPASFDCSELSQWAAAQAGVTLSDGSWNQYLDAKASGNAISVADALRTPGALLFSFDDEPTAGGGRPPGAHVAISLGDGRTVEARGRAYGVTIAQAGDRFTHAAVIPGLSS